MLKSVKSFLVLNFGLERIKDNFTVESENQISFRIGSLSFGIELDTLKVVRFSVKSNPLAGPFDNATFVSTANSDEFCQIIERNLKNFIRKQHNYSTQHYTQPNESEA